VQFPSSLRIEFNPVLNTWFSSNRFTKRGAIFQFHALFIEFNKALEVHYFGIDAKRNAASGFSNALLALFIICSECLGI